MTKPDADKDALEDLMTRFVLDDLGKEERAAFERKVALDAEVARSVEALRRTLGLLPYAVLQEPAPHLRARVLQAAAATGGREITAPARPKARAIPWFPLLAAAAASLVAVVVYRDNRDLRRQLELQEAASRLLQEPNVVVAFSLSGLEASAPAFGRVVLDLDGRKGAVVIKGLQRLGEGRVYRLWALVGTQKVPCGDFDADASGTVLRQFPVPVDAYTEPVRQLVLTVESAADPQSPPTGPTVMIGS